MWHESAWRGTSHSAGHYFVIKESLKGHTKDTKHDIYIYIYLDTKQTHTLFLVVMEICEVNTSTYASKQ